MPKIYKTSDKTLKKEYGNDDGINLQVALKKFEDLLPYQDYTAKQNSIFDLVNYDIPDVDDITVLVQGYFDTNDGGQGVFVWDSTVNKNTANGGTIIDPSTLGGFDGTTGTRDSFLTAQGTGVGTGCWVRLYEVVSTKHFGCVADGTVDDTNPFKKFVSFCISDIREGFIPAGNYRITEEILINSLYGRGLKFYGEGQDVTSIIGNHLGDSIINIKGSTQLVIENLTVTGSFTGDFPKCGVILGRTSASSSGWHTFNSLHVTGKFSVSAVYNVASEGNLWNNCFIILHEDSTAKYSVFLSGQDKESIGGLTSSTMLGQTFNGCHIYLNSLNAESTIFFEGAIGSGNISFNGCYFVTNDGSYVEIVSGYQDGKDCPGALSFNNCSAEPIGANPIVAFKINVQTSLFLWQLIIKGGTYVVNTGGKRVEYSNPSNLQPLKREDIDFLALESGVDITSVVNTTDYGVYTPSATTETLTSAIGNYVQHGNIITVNMDIIFPASASSVNASVTLPKKVTSELNNWACGNIGFTDNLAWGSPMVYGTAGNNQLFFTNLSAPLEFSQVAGKRYIISVTYKTEE